MQRSRSDSQKCKLSQQYETAQNPGEPEKNHYDTPTKANVQGVHQYLIKDAFPFNLRVIFNNFGVSERSGYDMIKEGASSRTRHHTTIIETRGRKRKVTNAQLKEADHIKGIRLFSIDKK